jgi:ribosomal protein S18 acetylase RimI-like enzyme
VRALGFATSTTKWWWTAPTPGPWIYFTAIGLHRPGSRADRRAALEDLQVHVDDPNGSFEAACESFGALNLERAGLHLRSRGRWYARAAEGTTFPPPETNDVPPDRLTISEVRTADGLADFERATCAAFAAPAPISPFDIHGLAILDDPAMHVLVGRLDGRDCTGDLAAPVVAGAMAYVGHDVVGIYGVGTVPGHRGHGYATALTAACLALAPDLPATLQPSAEAAALYRRVGFVDVGQFSHWG